jgi:ATP-dependent helicase YprA (DUF1998 family)
MFTALLEEALKLVSKCPCQEVTGCPGCIQLTCCTQYNAVLNKQSALVVLESTLEQERACSCKGGGSEQPEAAEHAA